MSMIRKVKQVQKVFTMLEKEMADFQQKSSLRCLTGCGNCCIKPEISVSVLEFLPYALELFIQRRSTQVKEKLLNDPQSICHLFRLDSIDEDGNAKGGCSQYHSRGLICRLFGFSTVRDKMGKQVLSTCKWIRVSQAEQILEAETLIQSGKAPSYVKYYQMLTQIDFRMGQEYLPINEAVIKAIDEVENYYQYRPFPYRYRNSA